MPTICSCLTKPRSLYLYYMTVVMLPRPKIARPKFNLHEVIVREGASLHRIPASKLGPFSSANQKGPHAYCSATCEELHQPNNHRDTYHPGSHIETSETNPGLGTHSIYATCLARFTRPITGQSEVMVVFSLKPDPTMDREHNQNEDEEGCTCSDYRGCLMSQQLHGTALYSIYVTI